MDLETGRLSHTGTPWHRDDAWNYIPNILKFPIGAVKIPAIIKNLDAAIKHFREGTTNSLFSANYLLKHVASDDSIFKEPNWLDSMPENYQPRAHIDAGYKGKNTTALTLIEYDQERDRYLGTGFVWDKNIIDNFDQIGKTLNDPRWKIGTLYIEDNADKGFSAKEIRAHHGVVSEYHESMNKHVKIVTFALKYWHKIWWTPATDLEYLNQILDYIEGDEPDDACLTADTKIITLSGNKNISDIKKGEYVLTPSGFKKVLFSGCTGFKNVITRGDLTGTKSHKIFIKDKFISLDSYTDLLSYDKISLKRYLSWQIIKECYLMEYGMRKQGRAGIISLAKYRIKKEGSLNNCIKLFGNFITKKMCQKATIFIIKILIKTITALIIWNYLKAANIYQYILKRILNPKNTGINLKKILIKSGRLLKSGIAVKKAWNGIIDMLKIPWLRPGHLEKKGYVFTAVKNIQQNVINKNIAVKNAATDYGKEDSQKKENVLNVGANSLFQKKVLKNIVRRNAVIKQDIKGKYPVFNLTVKDAGVFYANNILVSNCDSYASLMREFDSSAGIVTDAIGGGGDLDYILSGDDRER